MYAAMENKISLVNSMIKLGCDIQSANKERYTALHLSSMYAKEPTVSLLLLKNADPILSGGVSIFQILYAFSLGNFGVSN